MLLRRANLARISGGLFDVLVVGAGINGAVSAAALAGRGASVALVDRGDFGGFTSQESSNLVWGGFKYLENYELPLVFGLCRSRNRLMKAYPDNIKEISFLATLDERAPFRPWFAALGATAYWGIGLFGTGRPRVFGAAELATVEPVIDASTARGAVQYQDAYLVDNDSRFVFSFVRSAIEAGAAVANYVELVSAERVGDRWACRLRDTDSGEELTTTARVVVNAAGPFVDDLNASWGLTTEHRILYSKGIHLVVPRLTTTEHDRVLAFFDDTERLFYVIPMGRRSVIGTTDTRVDTPYTEVTDEDRDFLLHQINARVDRSEPLTRDDVIAERSGVRPLVVRRGSGDQSRCRLDLPLAQARGGTGCRARRRDGVRRQAHRLPQRRRGGRRALCSHSVSPSRRTCATGTASRPRRRAPSSTGWPGSCGSTPCAPSRTRSHSPTGSGGGTVAARSASSRRSAPTRPWVRTSWGRPTTSGPSSTTPPSTR